MISKIIILVPNKEYIKDYRKVGISTFLFALEGYSVGYQTFSIQEIEEIEENNKYLMINRMLDCSDIEKLRDILKNLKTIKGIIYEDIGVYELIKELKLDLELIYYQNHFGTNINQINFWLDKVDSMFVCNELTIEEIKNILDNANKPLCLNLYGHNQVMYSRRLLLSNWSDNFKIDYKNTNLIEDTATKVKFIAYENNYGTIMYSEKIFNGKELWSLNNVKYFYVNPMFIEHSKIINYLSNIDEDLAPDEDEGFLHRETIYKLKDEK